MYTFLDPRTLPEIQESIRHTIDGNITLFSLAFGNDANYGFLDTLSKQNNGIVRRIYEDSDAPLQLKVANWANVVSAKYIAFALYKLDPVVNLVCISFNGLVYFKLL